MKRTCIVGLIILLITAGSGVLSGCEDAVEKEVIKPVEDMFKGRERAVLETAVANVRGVRMTLMRYPATSPDDLYPTDAEIFDYESLREVLSDANLPVDMAEVKWDPDSGIDYSSDGYTFTVSTRALTVNGESITATIRGVEVR